jgi:hypothetical protein
MGRKRRAGGIGPPQRCDPGSGARTNTAKPTPPGPCRLPEQKRLLPTDVISFSSSVAARIGL